MEIFADIEQGSDAWFAMRQGIPTASEFFKCMAKEGPRGGTSHKEYVMRAKYMRQLAGEIITGEPQDSWSGNRHSERGKEREDEARTMYALIKEVEPQRVGFIRNGSCGASPDSLIGSDGGLELKDAIPDIQIERLQDNTLPSVHKWQVYGNIMISEREWWDFMSHCRGLPPLIIRVHRDEKIIGELRDGVNRFVDELNMLVEWIKRMF